MKMVSGKVVGIVIATIVAGALGYELTRKTSASTGPLSVGITEKIISQGAYVGIPIPRFGLYDFQAESVTAFAGSTIQFTATAAGGVSPYTYAWTFGDGGTGSGNPASHTFTTGGSFTVTVTVTDTVGNTANGTDTVTISTLITPSLTCTSPPFAQEGTVVTVSGFLKNTSTGAGISGETVAFLAAVPGGSPITIGTAPTNSTGLASVSYTVPSSGPTGNWTFYASFGGDSANGLTAVAPNPTSVTDVYAPLTVTVGP